MPFNFVTGTSWVSHHRMPLAGVRLAIHCLDAHARPQGGHAPLSDRMAFSPEQIAQHPGSGKRMVQMELVDPAPLTSPSKTTAVEH
jgi:hypothetical protein